MRYPISALIFCAPHVHRHPNNETDESVANDSQVESIDQNESKAPEEKPTETPATEPVTETKEAAAAPVVPESKAEEVKETPKADPTQLVPKKEDTTIQDSVDKAQASKAGQISGLEESSDQTKGKLN